MFDTKYLQASRRFLLLALKRLGLLDAYYDPLQNQKLQLKFFLFLYFAANLIAFFIYPSTFLICWILINILVYFVVFNNFFESWLYRRKNLRFNEPNQQRTFFEGRENPVERTKEKPKQKASKTKKEPKESYEVCEENRSMKKLPTQYYKEFSPHSNRLQTMKGLNISKFSPSKDGEPVENGYFQEETPRAFPKPEGGRRLDRIMENQSESDVSILQEPSSPEIKIREIYNDERILQEKRRKMMKGYDKLVESIRPTPTPQTQPQQAPKTQPAAPLSGLTTGTGTTPAQGGGLFGKPTTTTEATKPATGGMFSSDQKPAQPQPTTTGGLNLGGGTTTPTTGGLFGGQKPPAPAENKPTGGGLFGNVQAGAGAGTQQKTDSTFGNIKIGGGTTTTPAAPAIGGGLFGGMTASKPAIGTGTIPTEKSATTAAPENKSIFNIGGGAPSTSGISGTTGTTTAPQGTGGTSFALASGDSATQMYVTSFKEKMKAVQKIDTLIQEQMAADQVTKVERITLLRPVLDEIKPRLNTQLSNELYSILESALAIVPKFEENANNKVVYYGTLYYIVDNILKNAESYYEKGQKLSIYYRIALLLILNNNVPGTVEYTLFRIAQEIPVLSGVIPQRTAGMSDADFWKLQGFRLGSNGLREPYKDFDKRVNAATYIFFMLTTLTLEDILAEASPEEKNRVAQFSNVFKSKLNYSWMYWNFIKFYSKVPVALNTPHILIGFYQASAYEFRRHSRQVIKLMQIIWNKMVPELEKFGETIQNRTEKNDFKENKMIYLKLKLGQFAQGNLAQMNILTPVEESKAGEVVLAEDA